MKKVMLVLGSLLLCGVSHAAQVNCSGDYFTYRFVVRAPVRGTQISGRINISIRGGATNRNIALTSTSSDIRRNRWIRFSGQGTDGVGSVSANYIGSRRYSGTLIARGSAGNVSVPVICSLTGSGLIENQELFDDTFEGFDFSE